MGLIPAVEIDRVSSCLLTRSVTCALSVVSMYAVSRMYQDIGDLTQISAAYEIVELRIVDVGTRGFMVMNSVDKYIKNACPIWGVRNPVSDLVKSRM